MMMCKGRQSWKHFVFGLLAGLVVATFSQQYYFTTKTPFLVTTTDDATSAVTAADDNNNDNDGPPQLINDIKKGSGQDCYDYKHTRAVMDRAFQFKCQTQPFDLHEYQRRQLQQQEHSWRTMGLARIVMYQNIARYLKSYIAEYQQTKQGQAATPKTKLKTLDISGFGLLKYYPEIAQHLDVTVINWPQWDVLDLSRIPDNSFDLALSDQMLEHVQDPFRAQDEVHRVLQPGAVYVYTSCAYNQEHGAPYDYWRFQTGGMRMLARNFAGGLQMCGAWGHGTAVQRTSGNPQNSINLSLATMSNQTQADALAMQLLNQPNDPKQPFVVWAAAKK
eukprot:scaffold278_cov195-Amphora_coffeaeformis.AAC.7